jgi:Glycosyl hydrolases family 39
MFNRKLMIILLACNAAAWPICPPAGAAPADETPLEVTVHVDGAKTLRTMNSRRLGGTNVAMWYFPSVYASPVVHQWMNELHAGYIRLPGGSWANVVYWNGNGVRDAKGLVDPTRVGPDGYPAVDYSAYAPSFLADPKTLHPASNNWHGHVDVKTQQDFVKSIPGTEAMVCPNAGTGRAIDAAEWVKWANQKMGYNVRTWEIGNELGGAWEPGNDLPFGKGQITAVMYTKRFNDVSAAMRKVDPTIKIGGGAFAEEMLRDCGDNVDFVSIHTYPGSTTQSETQMFADIGKGIQEQVSQVRKWIHQYQPQREKQIEIAYSEWNLGFSVSKSELFSGLWASIFLGELATNGVDMAQQWDCFSDLLDVPDNGAYARKPEYDALWLWNNYMGNNLIAAESSAPTVYTCASHSQDAVCVMLINTDHDRDAKVSLQLSGLNPAGVGEVARMTSREYYWNPQTKKPQWSEAPRVEEIKTGAAFSVTLSPFSIAYVRIPDKATPGLSVLAEKALAPKQPAKGAAELRFVMPTEVYVGDEVRGDLIALTAGSERPYRGTLAPAALSANGLATFDHDEIRLPEPVGHFIIKPTSPGELTITAQSPDAKATQKLNVKPSIPHPIVFWDFTNPPVTDSETFSSQYTLIEDQSQRANRAVARVDLPSEGLVPHEKANEAFKVARLPEENKLNKSNIRGIIFDVMTSPDFACDDPDVGITVVMQSSANWWMPLGDISLKDATQWKSRQLDVKLPDYIKAMPAASNIIFLLKANKPVKGSIYFDRIGFMVR